MVTIKKIFEVKWIDIYQQLYMILLPCASSNHVAKELEHSPAINLFLWAPNPVTFIWAFSNFLQWLEIGTFSFLALMFFSYSLLILWATFFKLSVPWS